MCESHNELLRKPIVVLGAGRSGMNVLGEIIAKHESLAVATEPRMLWKYGNQRKSDMLRPEDARPEVIRHIRAQFAKYVRLEGKSRLVDVTPGNSLRPAFVDKVMPDCRFVHLIRDGVDNILSMRRFYAISARRIRGFPGTGYSKARDAAPGRRLEEAKLSQVPTLGMAVLRHTAPDFLLRLIGKPVLGIRLPGLMSMRRELTLLETCFLQWRASAEIACQFGVQLPPERYHQCRLEEFSPEVVRSILTFCDIDADSVDTEFISRRFDKNRVGPAKSDADPEEVRLLETWVEPTMQWLEGFRTARARER